MALCSRLTLLGFRLLDGTPIMSRTWIKGRNQDCHSVSWNDNLTTGHLNDGGTIISLDRQFFAEIMNIMSHKKSTFNLQRHN